MMVKFGNMKKGNHPMILGKVPSNVERAFEISDSAGEK